MIHHEQRGRAMPWVGLTALVTSHQQHLSCVPRSHQLDGNLGLGGESHVFHVGHVSLRTRPHSIAVILTATGATVGV
jgi:hypothetical protein